jgi:hypothetical protein
MAPPLAAEAYIHGERGESTGSKALEKEAKADDHSSGNGESDPSEQLDAVQVE